MKRNVVWLLLGVWGVLGACSNSDTGHASDNARLTDRSNGAVQPEGPRDTSDESVTGADDNTVVYQIAQVTIAPGTEAMYCHYLPPLEHDLVVRGFSTRQSRGGHHMVVYRALMQKPAGTLEECSTGESMSNLMLALTQTGTQEPGASAIEFPENHVVVLKAGMQFVAQSHYINTTVEPFVTSDTMTLHTTSADPATLTQLHLFVASAIDFEIPPGTAKYSASAGCAFDKDLTLLSLTPHMHEWGSRIELRIGDKAAMNSVVDVPEWTADMRDLAPITSFIGPDAPSDGHYLAGQSVALTCTWRNTETHSLKFPNEMCAMVGYFTSETTDAEDIMCLQALK